MRRALATRIAKHTQPHMHMKQMTPPSMSSISAILKPLMYPSCPNGLLLAAAVATGTPSTIAGVDGTGVSIGVGTGVNATGSGDAHGYGVGATVGGPAVCVTGGGVVNVCTFN